MTQYNRETLKNKETSFIGRTPPFNDPLIQRTEDLEIRHDNSDSQLFGIPTVADISPTSANFGLDFTINDEYNINLTTVPAIQEFVITISNLSGNQIGKLNITKLSGQSVSFGNGEILPSNTIDGQSGNVLISMQIVKSGINHYIFPLYNHVGAFAKTVEWIDMPVINGWAGTVQYSIDYAGNVHVRGRGLSGTGVPSNAIFAILPSEIQQPDFIRLNSWATIDTGSGSTLSPSVTLDFFDENCRCRRTTGVIDDIISLDFRTTWRTEEY